MKNARQQKILELIEKFDIDTQQTLIARLAEAGLTVTQTTISRDIKELKLVKGMTGRGTYKYILPAAGLGIISLPLIYYFLLSEYQQHRILVFFNPEMDRLGSGYNVIQSKIAVGSGQFFGKGFLNGTQNQLGFLPTKHTDFIFSVISEEFGFIGAAIVIILLFIIIARCLKTAANSISPFGKYLCIGVSAMLIFHTIENIGMCIGLMPVTGIPLPFFSYGGSSLITNCIAIGLVMSVSYHCIKRKY